MIKRIIEISQQKSYLSISNSQLVIKTEDKTSSIPCEDIGVLLVDNRATVYSHSVFTELLKFGASVVLCNDVHLPTGMLLPIESNFIQAERFRHQINAKLPLKKKLWQQLVKTKILHQASLVKDEPDTHRYLKTLASKVRSGDLDNKESQASRRFWPVFMQDIQFRRSADGPAPNNLLNYGYTVMRAAVARALVSAGLLPTLGIHHRNRYNAYCLADDIIEPFRGFVEAKVRYICDSYSDIEELNQQLKAELLEVLYQKIRIAGFTGPLMVGLHRTAASLARCYEGKQKFLELPEFD